MCLCRKAALSRPQERLINTQKKDNNVCGWDKLFEETCCWKLRNGFIFINLQCFTDSWAESLIFRLTVAVVIYYNITLWNLVKHESKKALRHFKDINVKDEVLELSLEPFSCYLLEGSAAGLMSCFHCELPQGPLTNHQYRTFNYTCTWTFSA